MPAPQLASGISGRAFCTVSITPLIIVEGFVVLLLGDRLERQERAAVSVGEDDVEAALFLLTCA